MQIHERESAHLCHMCKICYSILDSPIIKKKCYYLHVCVTLVCVLFYCARSTSTTRMPWVNWMNATTYPYPSTVWNVEPLPHSSLATCSPQSGNCPSICSKTTHTLTQRISRIMWYQGECKTERVHGIS